jgi:hypothetical protein
MSETHVRYQKHMSGKQDGGSCMQVTHLWRIHERNDDGHERHSQNRKHGRESDDSKAFKLLLRLCVGLSLLTLVSGSMLCFFFLSLYHTDPQCQQDWHCYWACGDCAAIPGKANKRSQLRVAPLHVHGTCNRGEQAVTGNSWLNTAGQSVDSLPKGGTDICITGSCQ